MSCDDKVMKDVIDLFLYWLAKGADMKKPDLPARTQFANSEEILSWQPAMHGAKKSNSNTYEDHVDADVQTNYYIIICNLLDYNYITESVVCIRLISIGIRKLRLKFDLADGRSSPVWPALSTTCIRIHPFVSKEPSSRCGQPSQSGLNWLE